ncbi:MAG: hypothetical protein ACRDJP_14480, partial [Actinomycetota bacterium]
MAEPGEREERAMAEGRTGKFGSGKVARGIGVLAAAALVAGVAIGPAGAGKFLTKKKAAKLFYTRGEADSRFLTPGQGDSRYLTPSQADASYLTQSQGDSRYLTQSQADARYYTQSQADALFALAGQTDLFAYCALVDDLRSYGPCGGIASLVDTGGNVGSHASMAIGADGLPVVSYRDVDNTNLKVAKCNDPACSAATISTPNAGGDVGEHTSLAIGTDGFPVISYHDVQNANLVVLTCNDAACSGADETTGLVDTTGDSGEHTSLAIGADGLPVISYYEGGTTDDLKVAKCNDAGCTTAVNGAETITTLDSSGDVGSFTSLAIGADDNPVISYSEAGINGNLKVAKCNDPACSSTGGAETLTQVDVNGDVGDHSSIAIGLDGLPIISYFDATSDNLKVAKCNDAACAGGGETITPVDATPAGVGQFTSVAIGADGLPVISYYDVSFDNLKVAKCNDAACAGQNEAITIIDATGDVGSFTSLA